jgi:4-alpha-glucanotransferase
MEGRKSGVLIHITSLPSPYGIGDMGPSAYKFVDFLKNTCQSIWQVLPVNATSSVYGNSPYNSISAFAGNTIIISPDMLVKEGLLTNKDLEPKPSFSEEACDYEEVTGYKARLFEAAYYNFKKYRKGKIPYDHNEFYYKNSDWLEDYALFVVIKKHSGNRRWNEWEKGLRDRSPESIESIRRFYGDEIEKEKFLQYIFFKQWLALKSYCNDNGIKIIGDIPIYVTYDSTDVWMNTGIFKIDKNKKTSFIAGVPPDYFSRTGQLWGNPVYRWRELKKTGYEWWIKRFKHSFGLFDIVRVDHFRGFVAFWQVPADKITAVSGKWVKAPAVNFFKTLLKAFPGLPIIAEDLGIITHDVKKIMRRFNFPGMRVLLFAFGEDDPHHPYLPCNFIPNCVAYTGTHDNNTVKGWFINEAGEQEKKRLSAYMGHEVTVDNVNWDFIKACHKSVADTVIIPMQDILGLGMESRMNTPSKPGGNWRWRLSAEQFKNLSGQKLRVLTEESGRAL